MIVSVNQVKTGFDLSWEMLCRGRKIAEAEAPFLPDVFIAEIRRDGGLLKLVFDPEDTSFGTSLADRFSFRLYDERDYIGSFVGKTRKGKSLFSAISYYEIRFRGESYLGYETGFGHKGLYLCLYRGDELLGIIEKELVTENFRDRYQCYLADESTLDLALAFTLYYDTARFSDLGNLAVRARRKDVINTVQKEQREKFDPDFIPRIKAMEV